MSTSACVAIRGVMVWFTIHQTARLLSYSHTPKLMIHRPLARAGSYEGVPVECRELGIEFGHHTLCLQPAAACSSFRVRLPTHPPSFPVPILSFCLGFGSVQLQYS